MLILGLETSGPTASVALTRDGVLLCEHVLHSTRTHSEAVMPMLDRLMQETNVSPGEINAIAVNCGPGSFTGVRIGVCTVNAMGAALHIPVVGVDALRALYENVRFWPGVVCVVVDAGNQNAYFTQYADGEEIAPPCADSMGEYIVRAGPNTLFAGDGAHAYAAMTGAQAAGAILAPPSFCIGRASALRAATQRMLAATGQPPQPMQAEPLYLRPSQAERMWSKRQEQGK